MNFIKRIDYRSKYFWAFLLILVTGVYLRLFNAAKLFAYSHDNDLAGWVIRDILYNHHFRLIGQETSTAGVFIGALYYYIQIPFYMLAHMDPVGVVFLGAATGVAGMISIYFVFSRIFNKETGIVGMLIYSISLYVVFGEREIVPTAPVFLWTVWLLYSFYLVIKRDPKLGLILAGFLGGLIWHLNIALIVPFSLILVAILISDKKPKVKDLLTGAAVFLFTNLPLFIFELRHNFNQTRSIFLSLSKDQQDILTGWEKVERVIYLLSKDATSLVFGGPTDFKFQLTLAAILFVFLLLLYFKKINKQIAGIFALWIILYVVFFSSYSKIVSEYYLNGTIVIFIAILAVLGGELIRTKKWNLVGAIAISFFCFFNYQKLINFPVNRSGYFDRKDAITYIESDAKNHFYPCVSISYITDPGYDRGYRYFVWLRNLKTKPITGRVPVYTIVFPLKPIFKVDKTFGAIGIIYPKYELYSGSDLTKECEGEDFNTADSMIGFTP